MPKRKLHIAAYDVTDAKRLRRMLHVVKDYATGGQKSAYECYLSSREIRELMMRVAATIDSSQDRFSCVELKQSRATKTLGKAVAPSNPGYFYIA